MLCKDFLLLVREGTGFVKYLLSDGNKSETNYSLNNCVTL